MEASNPPWMPAPPTPLATSCEQPESHHEHSWDLSSPSSSLSNGKWKKSKACLDMKTIIFKPSTSWKHHLMQPALGRNSPVLQKKWPSSLHGGIAFPKGVLTYQSSLRIKVCHGRISWRTRPCGVESRSLRLGLHSEDTHQQVAPEVVSLPHCGRGHVTVSLLGAS